MSAVDVAQVFATIFAGIALIFTAFQIRADTKQKRAQHISDFLKSFWSDSDILDAYYLIEYAKFEYDSEFQGSPLERKIDRLLHCLSSIAKLYQAGLISEKDLEIFRYQYLIVYQNKGITDYLKFLDDWYSYRGISGRPFGEFRSVGRDLEKLHFDVSLLSENDPVKRSE